MTTFLSSQYWTDRYQQQQTGWDIGSPSYPLKQYLDQIQDKSLQILIPGAGNAHEAQYAYESGFSQVHILDFSAVPLEHFKQNCPKFPTAQVFHQDFFHHQGNYDLILEQTFFCALHPEQRMEYVQKMHSLLKPSGKLVGVLFNREFEKAGPPFGGSAASYQSIFEQYFDAVSIEPCYNSIPPRTGSEVFIQIALPKQHQ
ncbi:methyltransferase domain-containing protein [Mongoliitalea daihaiensis]|uniref:methyltransferase domain-containing protein n=1 Tax=Mongoliitalea daihaiensis TaxID=2782006 RepID=UPI001F197674|nr:methyltransferase domain-containing protein [Mongoliitalea daihaiensis]UJP64496.1 methyltransferase domain-containing protein [Mongoliitalea daihaiensis]